MDNFDVRDLRKGDRVRLRNGSILVVNSVYFDTHLGAIAVDGHFKEEDNWLQSGYYIWSYFEDGRAYHYNYKDIVEKLNAEKCDG